MVQPVSLPLPIPQPSLLDKVLDVINPLQHIPFIDMVYRELTGDKITPDAQFAGGFLFGGPLGALGASVSMILAGAYNAETSDIKDKIASTGTGTFNA